jgi:hypothetical protein
MSKRSAEAEETVQHRARHNVFSVRYEQKLKKQASFERVTQPDCNSPTDIGSFLARRMKKRQIKEAVE